METIKLQNIPEELKVLDQWVIYNQEKIPLTKRVSMNKGFAASSTDPSTWMRFAEAVNFMSTFRNCGLGFVFSEKDPYVGIDLDKSLTHNPPPTDIAKIDSTLWPYAYKEISPSGQGVHYFVKGDMTHINWTNKKTSQYSIEVYDRGRYFTMTGKDGSGEIMWAQSQLESLFHTPMPRRKRPTFKSNTTLRQLIQNWGIEIWEEREVKMQGSTCTGYTVKCPWQHGHSTKNRDRDAIIAEDTEGRRYFHCFHASCSDRHWRDFKALYDPRTKEIAQNIHTNRDWIGNLM